MARSLTPEKKIKILFIIRICLWFIALAATIWWMYYSVKLHIDGIYDVHLYATQLRPVLYLGLLISFISLGLAFYLHMITVRIKRSMQNNTDHSLAERINR